MRKLKKNRLVAFIFASITLFVIGCGKTEDVKIIHTGYVPSASGAAIFHTLDANCLTGYKFETQQYKSSDLLALDLTRNQVQIALVCGMAEILTQIEKHPNGIVVIGIFESTPCFLVPSGSTADYVNSLNSGKKKVVGCWPGATFPFYTRAILDSLGLNSKNLYITPVSPSLQITQLEKKEIDAILTLEPIGVKAVVDGIAEYRFTEENLLSKYIVNGGYFPGGCLAVSKDFFVKNRVFIDSLIDCLKKEGKNISSNNPITIQSLAKYTSLLTHYTPSMKIRPIIMGEKMIGIEMDNLVKSLIELGKLDSAVVWKESFWIGE